MILAFYLFTLRKSDLLIHKEDCNWDQLCNIYTRPCMLFYTYSKWVHNTFPEAVPDMSKKIFHIFAGLVSSWFSVFVALKYVLPDRQHLENLLHKGWLWWENALTTTRFPGKKGAVLHNIHALMISGCCFLRTHQDIFVTRGWSRLSVWECIDKGIRFRVLYPPKCSHDLPPLAGTVHTETISIPQGIFQSNWQHIAHTL